MNCASNFASKVIFDCDDKLFMGVIMYIVLIESDAAPMTLSSWTIDQSFESEFETLDEAEAYVRSLERWSAADAHDELWAYHGPQFRIFSEEAGEHI